MKILSYEEKDGNIRVTTDYKEMPEFVYPADKFASLKELQVEIGKKVEEVTFKKSKRNEKKNKLIQELAKEVKKHARN